MNRDIIKRGLNFHLATNQPQFPKLQLVAPWLGETGAASTAAISLLQGIFPRQPFSFYKKHTSGMFWPFWTTAPFSGLAINFLEEATHPLPWLDRYLPNLSRHLSLRPIWLALVPQRLECNEPIFWMHFSEQSAAVSSYLEAAPASGWGKHWYFNKYQTLVEENIDISPQIPRQISSFYRLTF